MIHQVQFDVARLASYGVIHGSRQHSYPLCLATASRPSKYAEYLRLMPWSITLYVKLVFHLLSYLCHSYAHARFCHSRWRRNNARVRNCYVISGVVHKVYSYNPYHQSYRYLFTACVLLPSQSHLWYTSITSAPQDLY